MYLSHGAPQPSTYEEGDGIVPSTPTLFVPRRGDGFAEALNSPHVPQGRFVFVSSGQPAEGLGLSQLASEGNLGVDDTNMDLSQFDDNNGRSVPSTPLATSPTAEVGNLANEEIQIEEATTSQESGATLAIDNTIATPIEAEVPPEPASSIEEPILSDAPNEDPIEIETRIESSTTISSVTTTSETAAPVSSSGNAQTARRGRPFRGAFRGRNVARPFRRQPIVWNDPSINQGASSAQSEGQPVTQLPPPGPHQQQRIRLSGSSKYSNQVTKGQNTRGFRGARGNRPSRGSRGYQY